MKRQRMSKKLYNITLEAERDLNSIVKYTYERWGKAQLRKYTAQLETAFVSIGNDLTVGKSTGIDNINVLKCDHHYIFYDVHDNMPAIIAVLHSRMDIMSILQHRLSNTNRTTLH